MNSTLIIKIFIVGYIVVLGFSIYEKNLGRIFYYAGAIAISIGILIGTK